MTAASVVRGSIGEAARVSASDQRTPQPAAAARVAVLIPCHNEALSISKVVADFAHALSDARIFVYDNNSTDETLPIAEAAGAVVRREPYQGKGNVVRRMFADVEADAYVMVDGDDTYDAAVVQAAVEQLFGDELDLVNVARAPVAGTVDRPGHRFGNRLLTGLVSLLFGRQFADVLSGYKVFSRRFVKSFPASSRGFEIETELAIHALELRMPIAELSAPYRPRAEGSTSKLRTVRDGLGILVLIARLLRDERPLLFFGTLGGLAIVLAGLISVPVFITYFATGLVPRLPTAVLAVGLALSGLQAIAVGLVLDTVRTGRREARRLAYLQIPGPGAAP